ncbi:MAG: naringenin-chalcone synthase [Proteobacteria bacterium]|nr:naringenin-chalcone synthase [Pseudomonadota bacterium]
MVSQLYLSNFHVVRPKFEKPQSEALRWLARAHAFADSRSDDGGAVSVFEKLIHRFGCSPEKIESRGHELEDFCHTDWPEMKIFNLARSPSGEMMEARQRCYDELVRAKCEQLFDSGFRFARDLIHVTCTGYLSPSPLQRFVAERGAFNSTRVVHAYHMGCYAALPASRLAAGLVRQQMAEPDRDGEFSVDVAHTELCTLHFNPMMHTPEQLVVQSLFADGFIRYRVQSGSRGTGRMLKILAMNEEQIPDSAHAMTWLPLPWGMAMTLSREVPALISGHVREFIDRLFVASGCRRDEILPKLIFAIHPGGPRIIDQLQELLELSDGQIQASRDVLRRCGNMSSATLPHVWTEILKDPECYPAGTKVLSLAFGPGLTVAGNLLEVTG